jgi:hypothetical protein
MGVSLPEIARALGGKINGHQVLAPGPGHSPRDQSLSVRLSVGSPDGFIVYSHSGDDWRVCRDHVAGALGLPLDRRREARPPDPAEVERRREAQRRAEAERQADVARRQRRSIEIWREGRDPRGTIVETYLRSRCLDLPAEVTGDVLRYHAHCPWESGKVPAMVAALRCVRTGEVVGIHRTALTMDGRKVGRKMLGTATGAAIMLDAEEAVTTGLAIGEGIETCLAARQLGIRPTWALGSTANIAAFPVLDGVESLTLLGELGDGGASDRACTEVGTRWHNTGRAVDIITPKTGNDLNDVVRGGAKTWL